MMKNYFFKIIKFCRIFIPLPIFTAISQSTFILMTVFSIYFKAHYLQGVLIISSKLFRPGCPPGYIDDSRRPKFPAQLSNQKQYKIFTAS